MQRTKEYQCVVPDFTVWSGLSAALRNKEVTASDLELGSIKGSLQRIKHLQGEVDLHTQKIADVRRFEEAIRELLSDDTPDTYVGRVQSFVPQILAMRGKIPEECLGLISRAIFQTVPREFFEEASKQLDTYCREIGNQRDAIWGAIKGIANDTQATIEKPRQKTIPQSISDKLLEVAALLRVDGQNIIDTEQAFGILSELEAECGKSHKASKGELTEIEGNQSILERANFCNFVRPMSQGEATVNATVGRWKRQVGQVEMLREAIHWRVEEASGELQNRPEEVKKFAENRRNLLSLRINGWPEGDFLDTVRLLCEGHRISIQEGLAVRELLFNRCDLAPEWWPLIGLYIPIAGATMPDTEEALSSRQTSLSELKTALTGLNDSDRQVAIVVRAFPKLASISTVDTPKPEPVKIAQDRDSRMEVLSNEFGLTGEYANKVADLADSDIRIIGVEEELLHNALSSWLSQTSVRNIDSMAVLRALCTEPWDVFSHSLNQGFSEWCQEIGRLMYCLSPLGEGALVEFLAAVQRDPASMAILKCTTPIPAHLIEYVNKIEKRADSIEVPGPGQELNGQLMRLLPSRIDEAKKSQSHSGPTNGQARFPSMNELLGDHPEANLRILEAVSRILGRKCGQLMEFHTIQKKLTEQGLTPGDHALEGLLKSFSSRGLFNRHGRKGYSLSDGSKIEIPELREFYARVRRPAAVAT